MNGIDDFLKGGMLICSFCGKPRIESNKMITGVNIASNICDECVYLCYEVLQSDIKKEERIKEKTSQDSHKNILSPREINTLLDDTVIGQDNAKKVLSVAVYNHYKRIYDTAKINKKNSTRIKKSNILLVGPTGSGKTLLAQTLADILDVPFASADATTLTEAGYVGEDVENVLARLLMNSNGSIWDAERGIVYIDEIDKISVKTGRAGMTRDISGEGVQQALLKLIEGSIVNVPKNPNRKTPNKETIPINTENILFICGGAFVGLDKIVAKRLTKGKRIGFGGDQAEKFDLNTASTKFNSKDLADYGVIPELIGRLPIYAGLNTLDEETLVRILIEPRDSIVAQFKKLFRLDGVKLKLTKGSLLSIAKKSIELDTGARGLRSIMEKILLESMYDVPTFKDIIEVIIDKAVIEEDAEPTYIYKKSKKKEKEKCE